MLQFSIIIPVYNAADSIDNCIRSIISQTYHSFEILLIDDGSEDDSLNICRKWQTQDSRIRVFHQSNCGACSARNVGIKKASGKYIQFVDADDTLTEDCLKHINGIIEKYQEPDIVEYRLNYIGPTGIKNTQGTVLEEGLYDRVYLEKKFFPVMLQCEENAEIYYNIFNVLRFIKRKVLTDHKILFDEQIRRWEDMLLAMEVFYYANEMVVTTKALYNYYGHIGGGLGGKYNPNTYKYVKESYKKLTELYGTKYNMYSAYAIQKKVEQIERCVREICENENKERRQALIGEIISDQFFNECLRNSTSNEGIMCVRPYIQKGQRKKAYRKLIHYIKISGLKFSIRRYISSIYHGLKKGELLLWATRQK